MMESVQKFILCTVLFLSIITIGTHEAYAEEIEDKIPSTSYYEQPETPFEKTIHILYMNSIADLPQAMYSMETSSYSLCKFLYSTSSDSNNLYNTTSETKVIDSGVQKTYFYSNTEYYIYTLRKIQI